MSILESLKEALLFLRRDGLFIKASMPFEDQMLIETATYITDHDDGKDVDCLCVHEDDLGLGGSCVCEDITTGNWAVDGEDIKLGCVACPVCDRLAKPWALHRRSYSLIVKVHDTSISLLNTQPNQALKPMPAEMAEKIIGLCNAMFPEVSYS
jgi:hypothetical protein